ncbi:hypothetical protein Patl1_27441 [Pistacia atlantica]|uniref:Uncharacterized protein n=1 Tax=Pistacia atlantica TaxID=434234 RepID=A0ACC1BCB7_9ROSI|nr:hypothetical protein Patl1_27441 [Pistacia atlantica]
MAFLQRLILKRKPVLYGNCRRSLCSLLSAVPSDDDSSSSLPPQLPPFDYQPKPYLGPSSDKFLRKESAFWVLLCSITIKSLSILLKGKGNTCLMRAGGEQNNLLQHATTIYLHHAIADFAKALA